MVAQEGFADKCQRPEGSQSLALWMYKRKNVPGIAKRPLCLQHSRNKAERGR